MKCCSKVQKAIAGDRFSRPFRPQKSPGYIVTGLKPCALCSWAFSPQDGNVRCGEFEAAGVVEDNRISSADVEVIDAAISSLLICSFGVFDEAAYGDHHR